MSFLNSFKRHFFNRLILVAFLTPCLLLADSCPRICLTMIVKNEDGNIESCLTSACNIADCVCVCDMGSDDQTVAVVESFLQKKAIPGKVYHHTWKNFGYNRSLSIQAAQEMLKELGFSLKDTYLLLLDATMALEVSKDFSKSSLSSDAYRMKQKSGDGVSSCDSVRLLRADLPWESVGPAYDYVVTAVSHTERLLDSVWIRETDSLGKKTEVHRENIALLREGLLGDPNNPRHLFYLGYSYMCLGNYTEAIEWFLKRIALSGSPEELWCAKYMLGECYQKKNDFSNAQSWYLMAYESRPTRAEPLQRISRYYRERALNGAVYYFSKIGLAIPYPFGDRLFISEPAYDYELDEDFSVAAFYCDCPAEQALAAIDRLVLKKTTPEMVRGQAYRNLSYYVHPLKNGVVHPIRFSLPPTNVGSSMTFLPTNPSIQKTDDGYLVLCRTVNYCQDKGLWIGLIDPLDKQSKTRNFLLKYSKNFNLLWQKEIIDSPPLRKRAESSILGLEDCRLFFDPIKPNTLAMTCTVCEATPKNIPQMAYCTLEEKDSSVGVSSFVLLKGPSESRCEKNWLPYCTDGNLHVIYSCHPFVSYVVDRKTGATTVDVQYESQHNFDRFRGSAPPIAFDGGYLALVHEVAPQFDRTRIYTHRFMYLDDHLNIVRVSYPFSFRHTGVEFSCGMTLDHAGKNLIIACGSEDREAFLLSVDVEAVRATLRDL